MAAEETQLHNAPVASETSGGPHEHAVHEHESEKKPTGDANPTEDKPEQKEKSGEKREHDSTAAPTDTDKPAAEGSNAPDAKKQKTDDTAKVENGEPAPAPAAETNGEKKKPGRPKKAGGATTKKTERPPATEGIGSRTRSRTKAT